MPEGVNDRRRDVLPPLAQVVELDFAPILGNVTELEASFDRIALSAESIVTSIRSLNTELQTTVRLAGGVGFGQAGGIAPVPGGREVVDVRIVGGEGRGGGGHPVAGLLTRAGGSVLASLAERPVRYRVFAGLVAAGLLDEVTRAVLNFELPGVLGTDARLDVGDIGTLYLGNRFRGTSPFQPGHSLGPGGSFSRFTGVRGAYGPIAQRLVPFIAADLGISAGRVLLTGESPRDAFGESTAIETSTAILSHLGLEQSTIDSITARVRRAVIRRTARQAVERLTGNTPADRFRRHYGFESDPTATEGIDTPARRFRRHYGFERNPIRTERIAFFGEDEGLPPFSYPDAYEAPTARERVQAFWAGATRRLSPYSLDNVPTGFTGPRRPSARQYLDSLRLPGFDSSGRFDPGVGLDAALQAHAALRPGAIGSAIGQSRVTARRLERAGFPVPAGIARQVGDFAEGELDRLGFFERLPELAAAANVEFEGLAEAADEFGRVGADGVRALLTDLTQLDNVAEALVRTFARDGDTGCVAESGKGFSRERIRGGLWVGCGGRRGFRRWRGKRNASGWSGGKGRCEHYQQLPKRRYSQAGGGVGCGCGKGKPESDTQGAVADNE